MTALPKLYQRTFPSGKKGGSWYLRAKGSDGKSRLYNLCTKSLKRAEERRREYLAGKRTWAYAKDEQYGVASETPPEPVDTTPRPFPDPPNRMVGAPDQITSIPPMQPEVVIPEPIGTDVPDDTSWASDVGAAAGAPPPNDAGAAPEFGGQSAGQSASPPKAQPTPVNPQALVGLCKIIVDVQMGAQAWAINKLSKGKKIAGEVPNYEKIRDEAGQLWAQQLALWFPDLGDIPPWVQAVVLVGSCTMVQLANATDAPPESPKDDITAKREERGL